MVKSSADLLALPHRLIEVAGEDDALCIRNRVPYGGIPDRAEGLLSRPVAKNFEGVAVAKHGIDPIVLEPIRRMSKRKAMLYLFTKRECNRFESFLEVDISGRFCQTDQPAVA